MSVSIYQEVELSEFDNDEIIKYVEKLGYKCVKIAKVICDDGKMLASRADEILCEIEFEYWDKGKLDVAAQIREIRQTYLGE